jgi:hypothetical protein
MNLLLFLVATGMLAGGQPIEASQPATGSICIAPVADDGDPRSHVSDAFAVRIDDREWVAVPGQRPRLIPDIALEGRRVVRIRDGKRQIESFRFAFGDFASRDLCLWYKPWYATWSLTDAAGHGSTCRCSRAVESSVASAQEPERPKPGAVALTSPALARQSFSRRTIRAIVLQAAPVWLRSIYEDASYRFVYRDFGSAQYVPGMFVEDRKRGRWIQLLQITTEHARLGRSPDFADIPLVVGWDFASLAKQSYVDLPLMSTVLHFPDRISYDPARGVYRLDFSSGLEREVALTTFWLRAADLEQPEHAPLSADDALLDALVFEPLLAFDSRAYPADFRTELDGYLLGARRNLRQGRAPDTREAALFQAARTRYAARLIAVGGDEASALAAAYVDALRPCYEWEGLHDCPEREAVFADHYQAAHASGPFRSYLPLLSAHRWLCAAEAFDFEKNPDQASRSRQHYRDRLAIALRSDSAMIRYAASHLATRAACFAR